MGHDEHHDLDDDVLLGALAWWLLSGRQRSRGTPADGCTSQACGCGCALAALWLLFSISAPAWSDLWVVLVTLAAILGLIVLRNRLRQSGGRPRRPKREVR